MSFMPLPRQRASHVRWEPDIYVEIYAAAKPLVDDGHELVDALAVAQSRLPEDMQVTRGRLERMHWAPQFKQAQELYGRLDAKGRKELLQRLAKRGDVVVAHEDGSRVRWDDHELALLDRRAHYLQVTLGDQRKLWFLLEDAQRIELTRDRWRTLGSLKSDRKSAGRFEDWSKRGPEVEELLAEYPFDPQQTSVEGAPPPIEVKPEPGTVQSLARPSPPPAPAPLQTFQEAAPPPQATLPLASLEKRPQTPLEAFAGHFGAGLTGLVDAVAAHTVATLEVRLRQICEQLMARASEQLDERNAQLIPKIIQASLQACLGGEVVVPEVKPEPLKVDLKGEGLEDAIKIDVLGLTGQQIVEVKKALNGYADSVRFIDADKTDRWTPREVVLINARMGLGAAERKCPRGTQIHRFWGTATSALKVITDVYTQQGLVLQVH